MKITKRQLKRIIKEELLQEGLHDEGLKEAVSDFIFDEVSNWHDEARAELRQHVQANGFDLTQEVLQALGEEDAEGDGEQSRGPDPATHKRLRQQTRAQGGYSGKGAWKSRTPNK